MNEGKQKGHIPPTSKEEKKDNPLDRRILIVFVIIFTEVLGFTIVIPILPYIALNLGLNEFEIGLIGSIFSFCQLFASPIIGKMSDKHGRKPLLLFSQASTLVGFILLGFAETVAILVLARLVDGLLGSNMTVAQACLSDMTNKEDRTHIYTLSSGVFGAGLIFGPLIASLLSPISLFLPMFVAAGISLTSILLVIFFIPETNKNLKADGNIRLEDIIPVKNIKKYFRMPSTRAILSSFFIYNLAFMIFIHNSTLYAEVRFAVGPEKVGFFRTYIGILRVILQTFLVKKIIGKFGEDKIMHSGLLSLFLGMFFAIFIEDFYVLFISFTLLSYGSGIGRPILTSKLTNSVSEKEYATVLGVNNSFNSFCQIIGPLLGGIIFLYSSAWVIPLISSLLFGLDIFIARKIPRESEKKEEALPEEFTIIEQKNAPEVE